MNNHSEVTKNYYDSEDADRFYDSIWGGEDIHIGIYENTRDIKEASRKTVEWMSDQVFICRDTRILDLGSGYGGSARYLAQRYGCHVTALNLSEVENKKNSAINERLGLSGQIEVLTGDFAELSQPDESYDVVWSQDAFLHSDRKSDVIHQAFRVLKPGGCLIFTDPMRSDSTPNSAIADILERIHLKEMASPGFYKTTCMANGFALFEFVDKTPQLVMHYSMVLDQLKLHENRLSETISKEYLTNMKSGLKHWIDGGESGLLSWGLCIARQ